MDNLMNAIRALENNRVRLRFTDAAPMGRSRFGGAPEVPQDFSWPRFTTATYDDDQILSRPLAFLAQFDCREIAPFDREGLLPASGLLTFFYELGSQRWGFDPADRGCARVFWFPEETPLSPAAFPDDLPYRLPEMGVSLSAESAFPCAEDFFSGQDPRQADWDGFFEACGMLEIDDPSNRSGLLGWPDLIQGSAFRDCELTARGHYLGHGPVDLSPEDKAAAQAAKDNWQLLFQLDTVEKEGFELMFGDCGRIYFFIRKEDLAARRFDRVWLILQCG